MKSQNCSCFKLQAVKSQNCWDNDRHACIQFQQFFIYCEEINSRVKLTGDKWISTVSININLISWRFEYYYYFFPPPTTRVGTFHVPEIHTSNFFYWPNQECCWWVLIYIYIYKSQTLLNFQLISNHLIIIFIGSLQIFGTAKNVYIHSHQQLDSANAAGVSC